jgi:HD superfamily phosphohydrolase
VYYHHTIKIARAMFQKALQLAIENKEIGLQDLELTDLELLIHLKNTSASFLVNGLLDRNLYKRALVLNWASLTKNQKKYILKDLEKDLENEFYLDAILIVPESFSSNLSLKIEDKNKKIIEIKKLSPLTNSLIKSAANRANLIICAKKDIKNKVKNLAEKLILKEK